MKRDGLIKRDVEDELRFEPRVDDGDVAVSVSGGSVSLRGVVPTHDQREIIVRTAEWVSGAPVDAARLLVHEPDTLAYPDADIAPRAENAIRWDIEVPSTRITVHADGGELTLEGSVCWEFERRAADRAVRQLAGIGTFANRIEVIPQRLRAVRLAT